MFKQCNTTAINTSVAGFTVSNAMVHINDCVIANKLRGIDVIENATVHSFNNSGIDNTVGLRSIGASTIGKQGTQPVGTTAESIASGGVIR